MTQVALRPSPVAETAPEPQLRPSSRGFTLQRVRALLVLNALYFGVAGLAAGYAFFNPAVQSELTQAAVDAFSPDGGLGSLMQAYLSGALVLAIVMTFLVNLIFGSFVFLTLPSTVIPFAGILLGLYRAVLWGLLFAPTESAPSLQLCGCTSRPSSLKGRPTSSRCWASGCGGTPS